MGKLEKILIFGLGALNIVALFTIANLEGKVLGNAIAGFMTIIDAGAFAYEYWFKKPAKPVRKRVKQ